MTTRCEDFDDGTCREWYPRDPTQWCSVCSRSQSSQDAERTGFGDPAYWRYLDQHAAELTVKGWGDAMTRTLTRALAGNDGA